MNLKERFAPGTRVSNEPITVVCTTANRQRLGACAGDTLFDLLSVSAAITVLAGITFFIYWTFPLTRVLVSFSTVCAVVVLLTAKPSIFEVFSSICAGAIFAAVYLRSHKLSYEVLPGIDVINVLSFWGVGAVIVLAWRAFRRPRGEMYSFLIAATCPTCMVVVRLALVMMTMHDCSIDQNVYATDFRLGIPLWTWAGQLFFSSALLDALCRFVYMAIWPVQVLTFVLFLRGGRPMAANPFFTVPVAGVLGFVLYQLCPASGPAYAFGAEFPRVSSETAQINWTTLAHAFRNAIPSLHAAWAFIAFWSTKSYGIRVRGAMLLFVLLTLLATLGTGEHYVIDLIVALPFAVSIQAMGERAWAWAAANMAITILLCLYIRFGLSTAINPWIPVGFALLVSGMFLFRGAIGCAQPAEVERVRERE